MCHHGEPIGEEWLHELETEAEDGDLDQKPSFANEETDVEVELLEADDD